MADDVARYAGGSCRGGSRACRAMRHVLIPVHLSAAAFRKTTKAGPLVPDLRFAVDRVVGAIAVAPSNPEHLYVGTGEADIRSQIGFGDGLYKSTDAGRPGNTWD